MRWKWIVGLTFLLIIVIIVSGYAFLSRYDFNGLKPQIRQAVFDATGRELTLEGDIGLGLGLQPTLVVENVGLQNTSWGSRPQMATIKRLQIQVSLIPLLTGVVKVKRLILVEPDILIETNKQGNSNLEFRYAQADALDKVTEEAPEKPLYLLSALFLDELHIRDGHLTFIEGRSGRVYDVVLNRLTFVEKTEKLVGLALEGTYNGKPCKAAGTIGRLPTLVNPNQVWPVTLTVQEPTTTVSVAGEIRDVFNGKGLTLTISGEGKSLPVLLAFFDVTHVPEVGPFKVTGSLADPGGKLAASDLQVVVGNDALAKVNVTGSIDDLAAFKGLNLAVHGRGRSVPAVIRLFAESEIPELGQFDVRGRLTNSRGTLAVSDLTLELGTKDLAGIRLSGTVEDITALQGVKIDFAVQGEELENLKKVFAHPLPFPGPFRISGHAVWPSLKTFNFSDLKVAFKDSELTGSLALDLTETRPNLTASFSASRLDLRPLFSGMNGQPEKKTEQPSTAREGKVFTDTPLPLEMLHQADADIQIQSDRIFLPLLALDKVTARASLKNGHLTLTPLNGHMGDGTFDGALDLQSRGQETQIKLAMKTVQLDIENVLKNVGVVGVLEGKLNVELDVKSVGNSVAMLMARLDGDTVVIMEHGKLNERFIGLLSGDPRGLLQLLDSSKKEVTYVDIDCLVAGLDINGGVAKSRVLVLDSSAVNIRGRGEVDLATEKVNLSLKPSPKKGIGIKGLGKFSVSLGELTKPLKIGGTLADPDLAIDPSGTMVTLGKAIGGAVLLGPVGIAAALAGGKLGDNDPCPAVIAAAKGGTEN
jgi:uncharacterized protein involved in outer membrane biogenesis